MHNHLSASWARRALPPMALILAAGSAWTVGSRGAKPTLASPPCSPQVDIVAVLAHDPDAARINREIDSIFAAAVAEVSSASPTSRYGTDHPPRKAPSARQEPLGEP
jgi:hypothetical protein